jgi:hypothetical protein
MDRNREGAEVVILDTFAKHNQIMATPIVPQTQSPLFRIPAELRERIFEYALTDYPDPKFDKDREDVDHIDGLFKASRRTDTQLLRTCRAVYMECWFMPLVLFEHIYQTNDGTYAPYSRFNKSSSWLCRQSMLELIINHQAQLRGGRINSAMIIEYMHILASTELLVQGNMLQFLRAERHVVPQILHITLMDTPFEPIGRLLAHDDWLRAVTLPVSVREVHLEMFRVGVEASEFSDFRNAVDVIIGKWFFARSDGVVLYGDTKFESDWSPCLVKRDTSPSYIGEPLVITVDFRTEDKIVKQGRSVSETAKENAQTRGSACGYGPEWIPEPVEAERCCVQ